MQAFLLCDDDLTASKVRTILVRESVDCPASNVIPIDDATRRLAKGPSGLVVAILPNEPAECLRVLDILGILPRQWTRRGSSPSGRRPTPSWSSGPCEGSSTTTWTSTTSNTSSSPPWPA